jgi:hypothetical protein
MIAHQSVADILRDDVRLPNPFKRALDTLDALPSRSNKPAPACRMTLNTFAPSLLTQAGLAQAMVQQLIRRPTPGSVGRPKPRTQEMGVARERAKLWSRGGYRPARTRQR